MSRELLDESLDALLGPFTPEALDDLARHLDQRRIGVGAFVMPANVPGAGLHELAIALVAGATAIIKVSSREPFFFTAMLRTLAEIAPELGARTAAVNFGRERPDLMESVLDACNFAVALGDDATMVALAGRTRLFAFGSRASGALVRRDACHDNRIAEMAAGLARDVVLFEQRGCLSPHHLFLEGADQAVATRFCELLARELSALALSLPPARIPFHVASVIRRMRESARWRRIGGQDVALFEGPAMAWTVVLDAEARFQLSPGYRTVTVSTVQNLDELERRLAPIAGRLEAFAIAAGAESTGEASDRLARMGVTWTCEAGSMQSPPLGWRHGGGAFLDFISGAAR